MLNNVGSELKQGSKEHGMYLFRGKTKSSLAFLDEDLKIDLQKLLKLVAKKCSSK